MASHGRWRRAFGWASPLTEARIAPSARPLTDRWRQTPVERRGETLLGVSFRPLQAEALGLEPDAALARLLAYPYDLIRLGAYWDRIETAPNVWRFDTLDAWVDAAERAGKRIILNTGALKTFGYPEFFAPKHHLSPPLREGALITPAAYRPLLDAAIAFVSRVISRYRDRAAVIAWQVEHEAADPLGMEHSWRLAADFARQEVAAAREADPTRPILMSGFLPTSLPVRAQQWLRTRDQGDSLAVAREMADIAGIDYYPRHALFRLGSRTVYLDGASSDTQRRTRRWAKTWLAAAPGAGRAFPRRLMVTEGQAEPWETITTPPSPAGAAEAVSCPPERLIENYNQVMAWAREDGFAFSAYLFWGAEYWLLRERQGDPSYLQAFTRLLDLA